MAYHAFTRRTRAVRERLLYARVGGGPNRTFERDPDHIKHLSSELLGYEALFGSGCRHPTRRTEQEWEILDTPSGDRLKCCAYGVNRNGCGSKGNA